MYDECGLTGFGFTAYLVTAMAALVAVIISLVLGLSRWQGPTICHNWSKQTGCRLSSYSSTGLTPAPVSPRRRTATGCSTAIGRRS